ncbi:hypothetical protein [Salinarimonas soli]|uniref:Uncharacterized protein n=1 Tax=Salinarimonas soli TaxID=1638099 RepID=A0A5B2VAW6_9HYPH|nr:hypothetical protein [Salinarimonas soli]KAA2235868.1 hypothetical protein F0L46_17660 [Salinarimonas soli]
MRNLTDHVPTLSVPAVRRAATTVSTRAVAAGTAVPQVHPADLGLAAASAPLQSRRPRRTAVPDVVRTGKVFGGVVTTTCSLETAAVQRLACDPDIELIALRPHVLLYPRQGGGMVPQAFVPDLVARRRDGSVLAVALAWTWERDRTGTDRIRDEGAVRAGYAELGVGFEVWTEARLFARQARLNHARMLREHTREEAGGTGAADLARARDAISRIGFPTTVGQVHRRLRFACRRGVSRTLAAIMALAMAGEVSLDLRKPLDGASAIKRGTLR